MIARLYGKHILGSNSPAWLEFPIGYFECDPSSLCSNGIENGETLPGVFTFSGIAEDERPATGSELIAAFVHDGNRHVYMARLHYDFQDLELCETWVAQLELGKVACKWL
jgi:hypothetical protein